MKKPSLSIIAISILIISNIFFAYIAFSPKGQATIISLEGSDEDTQERVYMLDPKIAELDIKQYNEFRDSYIISYENLRKGVSTIINRSLGEYSFYFEDMKSGAWIGISEKTQYMQASLTKVPTLVAVIKKMEEEGLNIDQYVTVLPEDINFEYGAAIMMENINNLTVRDLINYLSKKSDNTAHRTLARMLTNGDIISATAGLGLLRGGPEINEYTPYSPKQVGNAFRSLYNALYMRRPYSRFTLALLANDEQPSLIKSVLPQGIKVSHKIGESLKNKDGYSYLHDCGIIYHENPYIICIMSRHKNEFYGNGDEARKTFSEISKTVYDYVSSMTQSSVVSV